MTTDDPRLVAALRSALKENERLRKEMDLAGSPDPIAVVGMGCRLPGGIHSPTDLWDLLVEGRETVGPLPDDRGWDLPALLGKGGEEPRSTMTQGSFLEAVGDFDPGLFGISPREAEAMDPQQRLLLEVAWESLERSGIAPSSLAGSDTGVYVGTLTSEYGPRLPDAPKDGYAMTGTSLSVASGRLSYVLGLTGPAITLDTACSSSLVAVHLAMRALRAGECSLALAGGATVMSSPGPLTEFTHLKGLAPDGRCKAFGTRADGAGFAEGVGMIVLERLSDARRNGHQVLALLRGGAINQDGASNGLTAPNGPSQAKVIGQALADAGLTPEDIDAVEAHGTGTTLGDPIEAQALLATYGRGRSADRPLWLGSLKSNVGHTQAAAGVAGLIKLVLSLHNEVLPQTLHVEEPTPHVEWDSGQVRLLTQKRPWPRTDRPRRAAVSSFGMSGTNAHVIVEQATPKEPEAESENDGTPDHRAGPWPWVLSARGATALRAQAARLRDHVRERPGTDPVDTGWSLATTRSALTHRAVVLADDREEYLDALDAVAEGRPHPDTVLGVARNDRRPVFVFPGQGGQWKGMAVELLDTSPEFARRMAECEKALAPHVDWSLTSVLRREEAATWERVDVVQPVLWAVMVSLAELWRVHGVRPAAVVGHSQGEIAAACVSGALTLEDAAKVVALRSRAILELTGTGAMASIARPADRVRERVATLDGKVHVAVVNGPTATVVAGEPEAVRDLVTAYEAEGVHARMVAVDYASHTPHVERLQAPITTSLAGIVPRQPDVPVYSTLTGDRLGSTEMGPDYWYRNLAGTVEFAQTTRALLRDGYDMFVEIGPHPVLTPVLQENFEESGTPEAVALGTLRRGEGGTRRFLTSVSQAHTYGLTPDWGRVFHGRRRVVDLPTYAFQRQHFWRPSSGGPGGALAADTGATPARDDTKPWDEWCYQEDWVPVDVGADSPTQAGTWLLFGSGSTDPVVADCVAALYSRGVNVRMVEVPEFLDRSSMANLVTKAQQDIESVSGVVSTLALNRGGTRGEGPLPTGATEHRDTVLLLQALGDAGITAPLWCLTRGAVTAGADLTDPLAALVWGFGRVAAQEHTDRWGGLIDLPTEDTSGAAQALASVLTGTHPGGEDQLAIRGERVLARRLIRAPLSRVGRVRRWKPSGTVLVTGGTGALGAHVARWLARQGAPHLLLVSRRGATSPGAERLEAELRAAGAEVTFAACDIAERDALAEVVENVPEEHPLRAVVHTAASLDDGAIDSLTPDQISRALGAKADGTVHLHELTQDMDLSAFVLFSSVSAVFGVSGQGNYAPGNAFCEAFAHHRRMLGLPATSVAWGAWEGGGMAEDQAVASLLNRHGLPMMDPESAVTAFGHTLDRDLPAIAIAAVDWPRFRTAFTANRPSAFIGDLGLAPTQSTGSGEVATDGLQAQLSGARRAERRRILTDHVCEHVAAILGHPSGDVLDADQGLKDLGMDSVTSVELRNRLSTLTGLKLPSGLVYSHPTCTALAHNLEERLFGDTEQIVMARIDGIETALAEHEDSELDRAAIARRLRGLLDQLSPTSTGTRSVEEDLESATKEELFAFIDDTLGD